MANPESETGFARDMIGIMGLFSVIFIFFITEFMAPFLDLTDKNK